MGKVGGIEAPVGEVVDPSGEIAWEFGDNVPFWFAVRISDPSGEISWPMCSSVGAACLAER